MLFLGTISWKGASHFNGGFVFQMRGASLLSGGGCTPLQGHQFWWGVFKKNCRMKGGHRAPPMPPHYRKPRLQSLPLVFSFKLIFPSFYIEMTGLQEFYLISSFRLLSRIYKTLSKSSNRNVFYTKVVLRNFGKFTEKHMC